MEFWKSPINYKGYKMANRKILLYGLIPTTENISLHESNDSIFLNYNNDKFFLKNTFEFKPYTKIPKEKATE